MRPVIVGITLQNPTQVRLAKDDDVIKALAQANRSNLHDGWLPFARERLIAFTPWHLDAVSGSHPPHLLHSKGDQIAASPRNVAMGRLCCKSRFALVIKISAGYGRGFRVKM
jgi:hypothetical protein